MYKILLKDRENQTVDFDESGTKKDAEARAKFMLSDAYATEWRELCPAIADVVKAEILDHDGVLVWEQRR